MTPNAHQIAEKLLGSDPLVKQLLKAISSETLSELHALVSVSSRTRGFEGQLPSIVVSLLAKLATLSEGDTLNPENPFWSLLSVAADAHMLGATDRWEARQTRQLEAHTPLLILPGNRVLLCPVGILQAQVFDALLHRAFVLSLQQEAKTLVIEVGFVENLDKRLLLDTLKGYPAHTLAKQISIVVTGISNPEQWNQTLSEAGIGSKVVECFARLADT